MGLFDFLKRQPKAKPAPVFEAAATLEELLRLAAGDPAYRPEFYRRILVEPLVVITGENPDEVVEQETMLTENTPLRVLALADGSIPVFTSPERIFDPGGPQEKVAYLQMKGRNLLETLHGATLLLNPYSAFGKQLLPEEVAQILAGTVLHTGAQITIEKTTQVLLGQPAVYPTAMTEALARLLSQEPRARAAYLGWMHDPADSLPPHYIICLDVEGEMAAVSRQVGFVGQQFLGPGEPLDIVQADRSSLTAYFRGTTPFYMG
ncbi:MAG: enhanced serine sensitivity protein SseB C-terminal domain-containing protein [Bacteroidota bacterium]|nr:enhanced serine sensitivity protein SseB C-terminal domain-containing protein [Bacteroidota bacterium]